MAREEENLVKNVNTLSVPYDFNRVSLQRYCYYDKVTIILIQQQLTLQGQWHV